MKNYRTVELDPDYKDALLTGEDKNNIKFCVGFLGTINGVNPKLILQYDSCVTVEDFEKTTLYLKIKELNGMSAARAYLTIKIMKKCNYFKWRK